MAILYYRSEERYMEETRPMWHKKHRIAMWLGLLMVWLCKIIVLVGVVWLCQWVECTSSDWRYKYFKILPCELISGLQAQATVLHSLCHGSVPCQTTSCWVSMILQHDNKLNSCYRNKRLPSMLFSCTSRQNTS